jgi:glycosyltransferase involved in cell wall biosynthesis
MRILFVHDSKAKKDTKGNLYTGGSYNSSVWKRYLDLSQDLTVMLRLEKELYKEDFAREKFNHFDKERIVFKEIDDLYSSLNSFLSLKKRKEIKKKIINEVKNTDLLIARLPSTAGTIAIEYAEKFNKPYMVEMVACIWDAMWNYNIKGKLLAPYRYLKTRKLVKKAPYVIYVTNHFLQSRYPNNNINIGLSDVVVEEISQMDLKRRLEKIKNLDMKNLIVIGSIGAVSSHFKGFDTVIKTIYELNKQGFNFEYRIVGGGTNERLLSLIKELGLEDNVIFEGTLTKDGVFKWLDGIDIYAQPSKQEGLPRALIEAMSKGCPCIGSNAGGIPELIESNYVFNKNNYNDFKEILKNINKEKMREMAVYNFEVSKSFKNEELNKKRIHFFNLIKKKLKNNKNNN